MEEKQVDELISFAYKFEKYYLILATPMFLMNILVIYTNLRCVFIDKFRKIIVLKAFYNTFVYHTSNIMFNVILMISFKICDFIDT